MFDWVLIKPLKLQKQDHEVNNCVWQLGYCNVEFMVRFDMLLIEVEKYHDLYTASTLLVQPVHCEHDGESNIYYFTCF